MANLVGLAFTSPAIAVMVIDRTKFRVHFYQNKPSELHSFLQEQDERLPVVLLDSVLDLQRIHQVEGIHSFLLSDDPRVIAEIPGANLLDATPDDKFSGFKKIMITADDINSALLASTAFTLPEDPASPLASLRDEISFCELLQSVVADRKMDPEFIPSVCSYLAGTLPKRSWVSKVQKPGLAIGIPIERMAELEKYIETAPSAEMLWRSYFDHVESGISLESVVSQFESNLKDLEFIISHVGAEKGQKFARDPRDKPLVMQKKRKVRKLQRLVPQGSSMTPITVKKTSMTDTASFDLKALLEKFDSVTASYDFSRVVCARLCGFVDADKFKAARKAALAASVSKADMAQLNQYLSDAEGVSNVWKAYCFYSYYVGVSPTSASEKFNVPLANLQTIIKYKPMAFVFSYDTWPSELVK